MLILMREICRVTWRSLVYHILLIRNVFDIFCVKLKTFCRKLSMLSIKFNLVVPFSPFKLVQSLLHPLASLFDFLMFFLLIFCCFICLTFLSFVRKTFLILLNVKGGFGFATAFHLSLLILYCFASFFIVKVSDLIVAMTQAIACI